MKPTIGRIVHYVARGSADGKFPPVSRVAIVTEVLDEDEVDKALEGGELVGLCVINPTGLFFHPLSAGGCAHDEAGAPGTWHWPPRA